MTIAGSIILIMLGAILTWAVEFDLAGVDIIVVGVIVMLGGLAGLLFALYRIQVTRRAVGPVRVAGLPRQGGDARSTRRGPGEPHHTR